MKISILLIFIKEGKKISGTIIHKFLFITKNIPA